MRLNFKTLQIVNSLVLLKKRKYLGKMSNILAKFNNIDYSIFVIINIMKFKIVTLLVLIRFPSIINMYFRVNAPLIFNIMFNKSVSSLCIVQLPKLMHKSNIINFYHIFASNTLSKKKIILATALKKRNNLFKKHNVYKRNLFYKSYVYIKAKFFNSASEKKYKLNTKIHQMLKTKALHDSKIIINDFNVNFYKRQTKYFGGKKDTTLNFFKKFMNNRTLQVKKHKKVGSLIRLNRHFNRRYYANRLMLKDVYLYRIAKQFTITRYAEKFKAHPRYNVHKQLQMTLYMTLLSAHFFFFKDDCFMYLKDGNVFVNGKVCSNPFRVLIPGDVVQLPVISTYYLFSFKLNKLSFYFFKKYSSKLRKLYLSKQGKYRIRSYLTPRWIHKMTFIGDDVPTNFEVDYTILSILILAECRMSYDIHHAITNYTLLYLYRTYNWRSLA